jgi:hypothetical protein
MKGRVLAGIAGALTVAVAGAAWIVPVEAQRTKSAVRSLPRTPWGDPDLQGIWTNTTTTPLERPVELKAKAFYTDDELPEQNKRISTQNNIDLVPDRPGLVIAYYNFWLDRGTLNKRTSLIVDPPDGRLPPLTPEGEKRKGVREEIAKRGPERPESLNLYDRCITRGMPGAMLPGFYNHNYHILQSPGYVAILVEMIHDMRMIPVDGRPHSSNAFHPWLGDSRGHWDGNTLVVETTNLPDVTRTNPSDWSSMFGTAGVGSRIVERFTRVDADNIDYQITVEDPITYTRSWSAVTPMRKLDTPIFEYACHEGNYAAANILAGARAKERAEGSSKEQRR